jgi:hypothetical protein
MSDIDECEVLGVRGVCFSNGSRSGYCENTYGSYVCRMLDSNTRVKLLTIGMYVYSDQSINKLASHLICIFLFKK